MISGTSTPSQTASISIRTRGNTTKIRCPLPQRIAADKRLVKEVQERIEQKLQFTNTPFRSVKLTASAPHGIKIRMPVRNSIPDCIEHYFSNLTFLVEQLGVSPLSAPGLAGLNPDFALSLSQLAKGQMLEGKDGWVLCQLAAYLMQWQQIEPALQLLKLLPEPERIKTFAEAFEHLGHPISYGSLASSANEQTLHELGHMAAVALYVTSLNPDAAPHTIERLTATCQRLKAPALTTQEMQLLAARYSE